MLSEEERELPRLAPPARRAAAPRPQPRARISPRGTTGPAPLSFVQERLWFFDQLAPANPAYNSFRALRLTGPLDLATLQRTLDTLVRRHEAFRTIFPLMDGSPVQIVQPASAVHLEAEDLGAFGADEQPSILAERVVAAARRPFDLARDCLLRAVLLRLGPHEHVLVLVTHHIVFDAWSGSVLLREFAQLYDACVLEQPSPLAELPIAFADFAAWQREHLRGDRIETQLGFWRECFADGLPILQLPTDKPRPAVQTYAGARASLTLPLSLLGELKALSRAEGATLFMTLLAAYAALLSRYSDQERIVVGSPIAGRTRVETEGLIGCFINTLAFNADLSGDPTFRDLLRRIRVDALGAYANQELPFERLVEELQPERDLSRTPVFQTMFQLRNVPRKALQSGGRSVEELEFDPGIAKFDLTLETTERPDGVECSCEYATDLFERATIERLLGHYRTLLESAIANPDTPLSRLPLLPQLERQRLITEWNATERDFPRERSVHHLFEEQVARRPTAIAIRDQGRELIYGDLNAEANRLAHRLRDLGVGPEVAVGVCMERSLDFVVTVLAILKAGGAYVPLDPSHPPARLAFMLEDSQATVVVTLTALQERIAPWLGNAAATVICLDAEREALAALPDANLPCATDGASLAYVIYTSGSTGQPKGVAVTHRNILRLVVNTDYIELGPDDVMAHASNCSFDAATFEIWGALLAGASIVVIPREVALSPDALGALLRAERITSLFLTTALFNEVIARSPDTFGTVRDLLFGGEAVDPRSVRLALEHGAPQRLLHVYGPTETTTFATWHLVTAAPPTATTIPIGRPIANTQAYVLDRQRQPVPLGVPGELYIGGDGVARGYLNRPELTAERFVPDPFASDASDTSARLYRTGDLVRQLADGSIEFLGRLDEQVKIRGFRIEPGEIEAALALHPAIRQAAVFIREDRSGGSNSKRLVAYVVPQSDAQPDAQLTARALRQEMAQRLPDYMIPAVFVLLDALPITPNGKVDRAALPAPDWAESHAEAFVAPRTATEATIARIWTEILEGGPVGIHDDFFALGGHSLLATRAAVNISDAFGVTLPVRALFEAPTIAALAERVDQARRSLQGDEIAPFVAAPRAGDPPLSFAQERFWFLDQLTPGTATYNVPMQLRIGGRLDISALERSLGEMLRRHEALRTTFVVVDGTPVQRIADPEPLKLPVIDLRATPEAARMEEALAFARREFETPFDLAVGPLVRAQLLCLAAEEHLLVLAIHHSVFDGWSMNIFYRELMALYAAFSTGQPSPLPDLAVQYADYAIWQRTHLQGDALAPHSDYWQRQLADAPLLLQLPTDRPRPHQRVFHGARQQFDVPRELADHLLRLSRQEGATLYMTLLAAFQTLLGRYTGQDDLLVGSPIAGRTRAETESLIGCFLNILVLRGDLHGDPTFRELLARQREVALGAYAHQDLSFERLLEILEPPREPSYNPVVQVLFILQNTPRSALELPGLTLQPLAAENGTAKYDLTLEMIETAEGLQGSLQYDSDLFDAATIARMAEHFQTLIAGIAADPDQRLSRLPLISPAEREQVVVEWNATEGAYPDDSSVVALFEEQVERTPDAVAFICDGETLSYRQLNARANQLARSLRRLGVGPESLVGVSIGRSFDLVVALMGIFKAGGAYVPLDPDYPLDRLSYMLADSRAALLLTTQSLIERFPASDAHVVAVDGAEEQVAIAAESPANLDDLDDLDDPATQADPDSLAYVLYTSGSTGQPKGVALEHRQLLNRFAWMWREYPFAPDEVGCQKTSINFVDSLWEVFGPLLRGVPSVIVPDAVLKDPARMLETLAAAGVTRLWVVPSFLRALLEAYPDLGQRLPRLTFWAIGGEALTSELNTLFHTRMPGCALVNIYGASEFFDATYFDVRAPVADATMMPIGRPLANMQAYVLDAQRQPMPIGVPGDLYIGGDGVARGYLYQPELTAERFVAHPFSADTDARLYRTGDLARWRADGQLEYLGRTDHQVKIRGFRVELGEIEATLARHPAVRQSLVAVREDHPGERQLVAYVVLRDDVTPLPTAQELRRFTGGQLPAHMTPLATVILPAFPLTPSGKVHRLALPAPTWSSDDLDDAADTEMTAPRNEIERELTAVWEETLGVSPIGSHHNFFDLGGHSLLAVKLFARIETIFDVRLPISMLFNAPTIEQLAAVIAHEQPAQGTDPLVTLQQGGAQLPLFLIHPLGGGVLGFSQLARLLGPERPVYGLQPDTEQPSTSIVEMATHYVDALRAAQSTGPYALVGYSAGGLIALEMAQQLRRQGETIGLLGMLDTHAGTPNRGPRELSSLRFIGRLLRDLPGYFADYLTQRPMRERIESLRVLSRVITENIARRFSRSADGQRQPLRAMLFDAWTEKRAIKLPTRYGDVVRAHSLAVRNYIPQPYAGHVTVFRAASQVLFSSHFRDLGWGRLAASVSVHHVPGSHSTLIAEPHVRELARQVDVCLREVQPADAATPDLSTDDVIAEADEIAQ